MGKFRETLAEGALHLGPERDRVFADLTPKEKERYKADIRATNILLQGLPKYIYTLINHYTDAKDLWDNVKMLLEGFELTKDELKLNKGLKTSNYDQLYAYLKQHEAHANENKMMLERYTRHAIDPLAFVSNISPQQFLSEIQGRQNRVKGTKQGEQLLLEMWDFRTELAMQILNSEYFKDKMLLMQARENGVVFDEDQLLFIAGGQTNTFDDDVDEALVQDLALNEDRIFQADQSDPIYDEVGPSYDSDFLILSVQKQYNYPRCVDEYQEVTRDVKNNVEQIVQRNVSSVPNDSLMMIINYMHDQAAQCVSANKQNKVVNESLTVELARYKEQVAIYEKRATFELTEREQKIDEQMRIIITDRNIKEETLKRELHSVKVQLNSTIDHNKLMKEEVATLKKDLKQKENKYLEYFLDMKALKEKSALYNGHEIVKTNHAPTVVHDSKDNLEIAEITRKKMIEKMKSHLWIEEVKEMKEILKQMEVGVEQNVVDKQCADIERKNLLVENENLTADFLSNEVLYSVMNDVNIVSRFSEMHDAYTIEQARCLELEAKISKLKHKIKKDDHSEMIKHFSNLEIDHLNLKLKY
ncbi:hypothetical protein Tco_0137894 [Tanacetum coccineum]